MSRRHRAGVPTCRDSLGTARRNTAPYSAVATAPGEPWRVFLVEDDATFAYLIEQILADDGRFKLIGVAESVGHAVAGIDASAPHIVLLDHGLPDAWGAHAAGVLRSRAPEALIVVLSGSTAPSDYAGLGIDRWLMKADVHELPHLLAEVIPAR